MSTNQPPALDMAVATYLADHQTLTRCDDGMIAQRCALGDIVCAYLGQDTTPDDLTLYLLGTLREEFKTPAQRAMGIQLVDETGKPLRWNGADE
jgi:hypothetical protein